MDLIAVDRRGFLGLLVVTLVSPSFASLVPISPDKVALLGSTIKIQCTTNVPNDNMTWKFIRDDENAYPPVIFIRLDGILTSSLSSTYEVKEDRNGTSSLVIKSVDWSNADGVFRCTDRNGLGEWRSFRITVLDPEARCTLNASGGVFCELRYVGSLTPSLDWSDCQPSTSTKTPQTRPRSVKTTNYSTPINSKTITLRKTETFCQSCVVVNVRPTANNCCECRWDSGGDGQAFIGDGVGSGDGRLYTGSHHVFLDRTTFVGSLRCTNEVNNNYGAKPTTKDRDDDGDDYATRMTTNNDEDDDEKDDGTVKDVLESVLDDDVDDDDYDLETILLIVTICIFLFIVIIVSIYNCRLRRTINGLIRHQDKPTIASQIDVKRGGGGGDDVAYACTLLTSQEIHEIDSYASIDLVMRGDPFPSPDDYSTRYQPPPSSSVVGYMALEGRGGGKEYSSITMDYDRLSRQLEPLNRDNSSRTSQPLPSIPKVNRANGSIEAPARVNSNYLDIVP